MFARISIATLFGIAVLSILTISATISYTSFTQSLLSSLYETQVPVPVARAWLISDLNSNSVVGGENIDEVLPIASISKLFTAHSANTSSLIDTETTITWSDLAAEGRAGSFTFGERYTLRELLFPLLLSSSNDAGVTIERVLGKEYMRESVQALRNEAGLTETAVTEPTGLSNENVSTARELAAFIRYLNAHDRYILDITMLHSYLGRTHGWTNNNPGRMYENFRGGKHGYTEASGRTFAGIFESGEREYVVVILGSDAILDDLSRIVNLLPQ